MTLRTKFSLMGAVVLLGFAGMAGSTVYAIRGIQTLNQTVSGARVMVTEFIQLSSLSKDLLVTSNLEVALGQWDASRQKFDSLHANFTASPLLASSFRKADKAELLENFENNWKLAQPGIEGVASLAGDLIKQYGAEGGVVPGLMLGYAQFHDAAFISGTSMVKVLLSTNRSLSRSLEEIAVVLSGIAQARVKTQEGFVIIAAMAVTLAILILFLIFALSLIRRLATLGEAMATLQMKDFTHTVPVRGRDELAQIAVALNGFVDDFSSVIRGVKSISAESSHLKDEVTSASTESAAAVTQMTANIVSISKRIRDLVENLEGSNGEIRGISAGIDSLATGIHDQSSFVTRSTVSVEQMTSSIQGVASITSARKTAVADLVKTTKSGGAVIEETAASVTEIFQDLGKIREILGMIDNIASMTNLLAMNAAIEAAHAGSAGRGFAVVAEEIRKLADATNGNAKNIKSMIEGISGKTSLVLARSEKSRSAFVEVDREVDSTSRAMAEISEAMGELAKASMEIMASMRDLTASSTSLEGETERMRTHTEHVLEGMRRIEEISGMVSNGMGEIEIGTREINSAMTHVTDLQARSGESVELVLEEVSSFKTQEEAEVLPKEGGL